MLACVWDAYNAHIPRIEADRRYSDYLVAIASSPYSGKAGRDMAESWQTFSRNGLPVLERQPMSRELTMRESFARVKAAFGEQIRE